ncbi:hypothetical protein ACJMK2_024856 [Sinanodonta woodiana]|uniref:Antistasin-like domain-containing protein n=1 Tax=Sinanodonta woodiana TaxID=1069815 RepID=A0ABD3XER7_SINWO
MGAMKKLVTYCVLSILLQVGTDAAPTTQEPHRSNLRHRRQGMPMGFPRMGGSGGPGGGSGGGGLSGPFHNGPMANPMGGMGGMGGMQGFRAPGGMNSAMSGPSSNGHASFSSSGLQCLRGDLVCPPWCLMVDSNGCKSCPCGPGGMTMMGMGGGPAAMMSLVEHTTQAPHTCIGTQLCKEACTGHYELGPVGSDGCQSCSCKSETLPQMTSISGGYPQISVGSGSSGWAGGSGGPGGGGGSSSSTSLSSTGHVMYLKPSASQSTGSGHVVYVTGHSSGHTTCAATTLCMRTCEAGYQLGSAGSDGCRACICPAKHVVAYQTVHYIAQVSQEKHQCHSTVSCMSTCDSGYQMHGTDEHGCPLCACLQVSRPYTHGQPEVYTPMKLTCSPALLCSSGCNVGYKCGDDGCPTCECIHPSVVGLHYMTEVVLQKPVSCSITFACPSACELGYKCGNDGCPTCECLVAVQTRPLYVSKPDSQLSYLQPDKTNYVETCAHVLTCASTCDHGYQIVADQSGGCSRCTCKQEVVQLVEVGGCGSRSCGSSEIIQPVEVVQVGSGCGTTACGSSSETEILQPVEVVQVGSGCGTTACGSSSETGGSAYYVSEPEVGAIVGESGAGASGEIIVGGSGGSQFNPFSIEGVSGSFGNPGSGGTGGSGSRGSFSHPAYSMFMHMPMAFPGSIPDMMYGGASHNGGMECIRGNIVCPEYCIMVDEWGCKACPCGPANGMSPPVVSHDEGPPRESKGGDCLGTVICMMTCKDGYILGPKGHDGCQSCSCSKKALILATSAPEQKLCAETVACMLACKDTGYELGHDDNHGCPPCKCLQHPVPPTTPSPTREPDFLTLMRNCPETVHCMKNCKNGYTLEAYQTGSCPACRCHTATTFVLLCEEQLYCPQGCSVGYKCDETSRLSNVYVHKTIRQNWRCMWKQPLYSQSSSVGQKFSCAERCSFGYKTGSNGCPTCACLEPVLVVDSAGGDGIAEGHTNAFPVTGGTMHVSGTHDFQTNCIGPECSAKNGLGHFLPLTGQTGSGGHLLAGGSTNPGHNGNSGHQSTSSGSSASPGASDGSVTLRAPGIADIMKTCPALAACVEKCTVGYDIGPAAPGQCPPCQCSYKSHPIKETQISPLPDQTTSCTGPECNSEGRKQTGILVSPSPLVNAISSVEKPCKGTGCARDESSYLNANSSPTQPITEACMETVQCVRHCEGEYTLRYNGRTTCPSCECASTGRLNQEIVVAFKCNAFFLDFDVESPFGAVFILNSIPHNKEAPKTAISKHPLASSVVRNTRHLRLRSISP